MRHLPAKASKENGNIRSARSVLRRSAEGARPANIHADNDPLEHEAKLVADHLLQGTAAAGGHHSATGDEPGTSSPQIKTGAADVMNHARNGSGQPLDGATRAMMEPRLGWDLGRVRVHDDARAAESARSMGASAYTVGHDIVFDSGRYAPATSAGQRLLAHELTHVRQQQSIGPRIQREKALQFDAGKTADAIEKQVLESHDEHGALQALSALEMEQLLLVANKLYDNWRASKGPDPMITMPNFGDTYATLGTPSAWALLSIDLFLSPPNARTSAVTKDLKVTRLRAAFDSARVHQQRNPKGKDKGTEPTHAGARDLSKLGQQARPGDWGEDPWGNTWIMHEGNEKNADEPTVRTYWHSTVAKDLRSSQWLGNNIGNFGYNPPISKRAIGSFHWGKDYRAIYLREEDSGKDLRDNMRPYKTVGDYVDKGHLGPEDNRQTYFANMGKEVKFSPGDSTADWVNDNGKWKELLKGFKRAEGWVKGTEVTTERIKEWSAATTAGSKEAEQINYYAGLLGAPTKPAASPAAAPAQ